MHGNKPDKGLMNGSCNRTACQAPLNCRPQFSMVDHMTGGRLYYCAKCERMFSEWDRQIGEPLRCSPVVATPDPNPPRSDFEVITIDEIAERQARGKRRSAQIDTTPLMPLMNRQQRRAAARQRQKDRH